MRILFISEYYPPKIMGGGEINLSILAESLAKKEHEVVVLTSIHEGLKPEEIINDVKILRKLKTGDNASGILNNFKRSLIYPRSIKKQIDIIKKINPNFVHFIGNSVIAAKYLSKLNIPLFATIESYPSLCPKGDRIYNGKKECEFICSPTKFIKCQSNSSEIEKMKNKFYFKYNPLFLIYIYIYYKRLNLSLKHCNLIAISEYLKDLLKKHNLKSEIIGNAINIGLFDPKNKTVNKLNNDDNNKIKIVYLGSLTKYKGPQILLKAITDLSCSCELYGEGPLKEDLQEIIKENNLDARINLPVSYDKVPEIYLNADIVVFPSIWPEPFGRIVIESAASKTMVIGSNIGGIKETILNCGGELFEPGDIKELREKIIKHTNKLENKNEEKVESFNKEKIKEYSTNNIIKKLELFYQEK